MSEPLHTYRGGCHCGRVRFEVDAPPALDAIECNCSICRMTGFVHLIVPASRFRLTRGEDQLVDYRFNTGTARHRFCAHCGVKPFYTPRSHPQGMDVNVRCLDDIALDSVRLTRFDDRDREASTAAIAYLDQDGS